MSEQTTKEAIAFICGQEQGIVEERERIIQLLHSEAGKNILVKGGNAFGNAIMLEVLIKEEEQ